MAADTVAITTVVVAMEASELNVGLVAVMGAGAVAVVAHAAAVDATLLELGFSISSSAGAIAAVVNVSWERLMPAPSYSQLLNNRINKIFIVWVSRQ
jgi:hypothetical protein